VAFARSSACLDVYIVTHDIQIQLLRHNVRVGAVEK
jgi:hypothetical protein